MVWQFERSGLVSRNKQRQGGRVAVSRIELARQQGFQRSRGSREVNGEGNGRLLR